MTAIHGVWLFFMDIAQKQIETFHRRTGKINIKIHKHFTNMKCL